MPYTPGDAVPAVGHPDRHDYNEWRWGDKKNPNEPIPLGGHPDRAEYLDYKDTAAKLKNRNKAKAHREAKGEAEAKATEAAVVERLNAAKAATDSLTKKPVSKKTKDPKVEEELAKAPQEVPTKPEEEYEYPKIAPIIWSDKLNPKGDYTPHNDRLVAIAEHLDRRLGEIAVKHPERNISDLEDDMYKGWDAISRHNEHDKAKNYREAKAVIKEAATHLSSVASRIHQRFGLDPVEVEGQKFHLGDLAVDTSNGYVKHYATGFGGHALPEQGHAAITTAEGQTYVVPQSKLDDEPKYGYDKNGKKLPPSKQKRADERFAKQQAKDRKKTREISPPVNRNPAPVIRREKGVDLAADTQFGTVGAKSTGGAQAPVAIKKLTAKDLGVKDARRAIEAADRADAFESEGLDHSWEDDQHEHDTSGKSLMHQQVQESLGISGRSRGAFDAGRGI